ncbi:hypothetical protein HDF15_003346 [Granulicella mallensis]|uniref:Uncharacterized protein n=1 Tax=Granulicella mallensis TaxID=940614 RepID=A0A7W8EAX0_9BACT|nr:hypothetical protein [Granulicella mallensis]
MPSHPTGLDTSVIFASRDPRLRALVRLTFNRQRERCLLGALVLATSAVGLVLVVKMHL